MTWESRCSNNSLVESQIARVACERSQLIGINFLLLIYFDFLKQRLFYSYLGSCNLYYLNLGMRLIVFLYHAHRFIQIS